MALWLDVTGDKWRYRLSQSSQPCNFKQEWAWVALADPTDFSVHDLLSRAVLMWHSLSFFSHVCTKWGTKFSTTLNYVCCLHSYTFWLNQSFSRWKLSKSFATFNIQAEFQSKSLSVFEDMPALTEMSAFNCFFSCRKLPIMFFAFSTAITGRTIVFKPLK